MSRKLQCNCVTPVDITERRCHRVQQVCLERVRSSLPGGVDDVSRVSLLRVGVCVDTGFAIRAHKRRESLGVCEEDCTGRRLVCCLTLGVEHRVLARERCRCSSLVSCLRVLVGLFFSSSLMCRPSRAFARRGALDGLNIGPRTVREGVSLRFRSLSLSGRVRASP